MDEKKTEDYKMEFDSSMDLPAATSKLVVLPSAVSQHNGGLTATDDELHKTSDSLAQPTQPESSPETKNDPLEPVVDSSALQKSDSLQSWAEAKMIAEEETATIIQYEDSLRRGAPVGSNMNVSQPVKWTPSQQKSSALTTTSSKTRVMQQTIPEVVRSVTAVHPPAITLLQNDGGSNATLPPYQTNSTATLGSLHVGGPPRLTPSSFQPLILQTTSIDNFAPCTPRGRLSVAIGEPVEVSYDVSYAPSSIALSGGMAANLQRYTAAALPLAPKPSLQKQQQRKSKSVASTPHSIRLVPGQRHPLSTWKQKENKKSPTKEKKTISPVSNNKPMADRYKRKFGPPSSAPPAVRGKNSVLAPVKSKQQGINDGGGRPSAPHSTTLLKKLSSNASSRSGKSAATLSKKSSAASSKPGEKTATPSKSKSSLGQRKVARPSKHVHGEHIAAKYRQPSFDEASMAAGEGVKRLSTAGNEYGLIMPTTKETKSHGCNHNHHPPPKKRQRLTDEQKQQQRTSGGQPLAIPPLTRCQSGEGDSVERRSINKLYHFPSFSGRSSADCEYIEVIGAARPPIETPLTQAIFDNPEHVRLIDEVDKLTGGPHNYRNERDLEDMYGVRVKKFWDRYQLHGTAYLDHLRKDPKYHDMPPSVRQTTKQLHANNEHLCQHLYYIKSAACSPFIDNRLPHMFGESINVEAAARANAWRKRTELNYKLFQIILRTRPFCVDAEECLRESLQRLSWQLFIAKQPKTIKVCKRRLEYNTKCLNDPNYDLHGPSWWRPLSRLESSILADLLEAQKNDSNEGVCKAMQRFDIHFEQYHLQEALDMCNYGRGATSVGDVSDPLELLYYLRITPPVRDGPYRLRTFFFVGIVRSTPQPQIIDVRETMKHFLNWRQALSEMHKIQRELAGQPKWPKKVFERLRNIRDAMKIYPGSPYSHINIRWLMHDNKLTRQYVRPGPFHIKDNLREFQRWAATKHYIITKLPDFGRLPQFQKFYVKALAKFRPPERVFLDNR